ncbi:NADH-quinone oxidoreductase subunit C [Streptomyces sp. NPDC094448]|uniref:NADH-quinone oxidoreductase subunit C n=1 Tax=Streptomyces sp. NPDC094448 TaxID=3366063 RepID=UPI0037F54F41
MTAAYDRLPDAAAVTELFGPEATAESAYDLLTVDVPAAMWLDALETARSTLGCTYFDWLSAVDEPGTGFRVCAHLAALPDAPGGRVRRLLLRTTVPHEDPVLPSAVAVYAGAEWHERETHEMFGVGFTGHPHLAPLLLPDGFEGHPLRKDFVLAARVVKAWPGAKEPGESGAGHGGPKRRQMLPPGVPDPNEWGPLKGQLPPAPARPARTPRTTAAAGERPVRRARTAGEGSASQAPGAAEGPAAPRRSRSASEGSASRPTPSAEPARETPVPETPPRPPRRSRSASDGSVSQTPDGGTDATAPADATEPSSTASTHPAPAPGTRRDRATEDSGTEQSGRPRGTDAPWHHARPAFDDTAAAETPEPGARTTASEPGPKTAPEPEPASEPAPEPASPWEPEPASEPAPGAAPATEAAPPAPPAGPGTGPETAAPEPQGGPAGEASGTGSADDAPRAEPRPAEAPEAPCTPSRKTTPPHRTAPDEGDGPDDTAGGDPA